MARPTSRALALLELLQSGGTRTVAELADRLGVDERTVRRYAGHLLDLDVPVESVRGRYGGYRLAAGYRIPPLMLGDDEALAVLLGLVAGRRAGLLTASETASETAAAKIRRCSLNGWLPGSTPCSPRSPSRVRCGRRRHRTPASCLRWPTPSSIAGRSGCATSQATADAASAWCTRTAWWHTRDAGT